MHTLRNAHNPASALSTITIAAVASLALGCSAGQTRPAYSDMGIGDRIARAHGSDAWYAHKAVQADITVTFNDKQVIHGSMLFDPAVGQARLTTDPNVTIVFDGQTAWQAPAESEFDRGRFHVLTWPYFLAAPFKMNDPGVTVDPLGPRMLENNAYASAKVTFDPGAGDAPDDWYILYYDPITFRLDAMAYIVTYGKAKQDAEKQPHAIVYHDPVNLDGAIISTRWTFWNWSAEKGVHGQQLGEVLITNPRFVTPPPDAFAKPTNTRELPAP